MLHEGGGSPSRLHHALSIGWGRAAQIIGLMTDDGILDEYVDESPLRCACLITREQWEARKTAAHAPHVSD